MRKDNLGLDSKLKVTVFGGAGFLGSHVADQLSSMGHQVRIFDLEHSKWLSGDQEMIIGDLLDMDAVSDAVNGADIVYNFAAVADLNEAINKPLDTIRVNVLGNTHILEACKKYPVKRFVYASTVYVYSREGGFYRCSKQASEHIVEEYQSTYGLDYTILRYGSIYGPRADEHNGLFRIVKKMLSEGVISYKGHPDSMREYVHIDDVSRASVAVLGEEFKNESVILTGQEQMRVYDMLRMLAEITDVPEENVVFVDGDYTGHYVRTPYAYQPKFGRKYIPQVHVDLGQGLLQLIEDVRKQILNNENCKI